MYFKLPLLITHFNLRLILSQDKNHRYERVEVGYIEEYTRLRGKLRETMAKDPSRTAHLQLAREIGVCVETLESFNIGNNVIRSDSLSKIDYYYKRIEEDASK